jgi:CheY-like chemotaxis protein
MAQAIGRIQGAEALRKAIHAREHMLAVVSHDLRNPLGTILMSIALLLKAAPGQARTGARRHEEAIHRAAKTMDRLIGDLLDVATIEAGQFTIEPRACPATALVRDALQAQEPLAAQKSLQLRAKADVGDVGVFCDRTRIQQVFSNLIGNAIKFTPEGGSITLRAEVVSGEARFSLSDTGPGIAPDELPRIFDRFCRTNAPSHQGTGLGLSIAKGIIESHGGRIWVESTAGTGSTFFFTLPVSVESASSTPSPPGFMPKAAGGERIVAPVPRVRTVLIVDDDADSREVLAETVKQEGYNVATAVHGAMALDYLRGASTPSLILLDLNMPVMDGWGFLAERNRDSSLRAIPVVVISGQRGAAERVSALNAGYLQKPICWDKLVAALARAAD